MRPDLLKYFFPVLWFCCLTLFAQNENDQVKIETIDGNEYIGKIVEENNDDLVLETESLGRITIKKVNVKTREIISVEKIKDGKYWFDNPQSTRYFWSPNGYGLKKGEGYYQNVWVLFNQVSVGVTDNFSVGFGTIPLFLFGASTPVWLTPKFSIPVVAEKFNIGAGALVGTVIGEEESGFGLLYGITTFGSRDKNISIGLGYGYAGEKLADTPTVSVSSLIRTSQRGYFITENYYIDTGEESLVLISLGGRRIIKKVGLDFGLFIPFSSDQESFIAIPWLGLTVPFGKPPE